jgi:hypothetical protein
MYSRKGSQHAEPTRLIEGKANLAQLLANWGQREAESVIQS